MKKQGDAVTSGVLRKAPDQHFVKGSQVEDGFEAAVKQMNKQQLTELIDLLFESQLVPIEPYPANHAFGRQEETGTPR